MPGMMDTVLNLGLNHETVEALAREMGDRRFAFDAYRRLLQMYGDVVLGADHGLFEAALREIKAEEGGVLTLDKELSAAALERLVGRYEGILEQGGKPFPRDAREQLRGAVGAVFSSWDNARARRYRRISGIDDDWGTACTVQAMVFGNLGEQSGSGVAFTRNPSSGEGLLYGEYLANAQGEDVVAGIRTPLALTALAAAPGQEEESLERRQPEVFAAVARHCAALEAHFRDMQDVEFTIERGEVFILQTRAGKRTAHAAVRIAVELVEEGKITPKEAVLRVDPASLDQLLHARLPPPEELAARGTIALASGLPASPGAATGRIVLHADEAERLALDGEAVILVRRETSPEDIHGMKAAQGILTATGGMTSHAAVVARGLGKCCVSGCGGIHVDYDKGEIHADVEGGPRRVLKVGELITLDGSHGRVYAGALEVEAAASVPELERLMVWADELRRMRVRANADTPRQAREARSFGAEGIGLCRTEHMFFAEDRLDAVRCMALAPDSEARVRWLERIEPMQQGDFEAIFRAMDGLPVTIRFLDWPLHEFLPRELEEHRRVAEALGIAVEEVRERAESLREINPMLGHRGVRVGLVYPEIFRMQARAILRAAQRVAAEGVSVHPELMLPVVAFSEEMKRLAILIKEEAEGVFGAEGARVPYLIGTMIELPRACLRAGELAKTAEFFSFGTNDLTQTTMGISRDDSGKFLPYYIDELRMLPADPFARIDEAGVFELVQIACERGRAARPGLKLGLCGEHGGDPDSIALCERAGLDYVSTSPPRIPIARLAAAHATARAAAAAEA
ncbi:MAG: pyruvate, phosphate dikinase, partial [Myxococcales bacterium]|nr:pyruvate, phosphate dikinase [Myxococcales bacterium]